MKKSLFRLFSMIIVLSGILLDVNTKASAIVNLNKLSNEAVEVNDNNGVSALGDSEENREDNEDRDIGINDIDFRLLKGKEDDKCIKQPEAGKRIKIIEKEDVLKIIDEKDGWYIVDIDKRLYWCKSADIIKEEDRCKVKERKVLHEVSEVTEYKKGQVLNVVNVCNNYYKIKTSDGYYGWINSKFTYKDKGLVMSLKDAAVYHTAELSPMNKIKSLKCDEVIEKIDERKDYYLILSEGRMSWCRKDKVQILNDGYYKLRAKENIEIYEAGSSYTYRKGEKITVCDGSCFNAIKVKTPKGSYGWILRDNVTYDKNRNLVAAKDAKVYYTGNEQENTPKKDGIKLADTAKREAGYKEEGNNETKYGRWYGFNAEWCAIFVSWCAYNSGINENIIPKHSYCMDGVNNFVQNKCWYSPSQYKPKTGDIVYFYEGGGINHIGIVETVNDSSVITIEGNMSDRVLEVKHNLNDSAIAGYASPIYEK